MSLKSRVETLERGLQTVTNLQVDLAEMQLKLSKELQELCQLIKDHAAAMKELSRA